MDKTDSLQPPMPADGGLRGPTMATQSLAGLGWEPEHPPYRVVDVFPGSGPATQEQVNAQVAQAIGQILAGNSDPVDLDDGDR